LTSWSTRCTTSRQHCVVSAATSWRGSNR
jgi:hypothetical protein